MLLLTVGSGAVLVATRKSRVPPATHAHVAMLVAWMPNTVLLIALIRSPLVRYSGYYLAVIVLVAYIVEAVLRVRGALRSDPDR